jgi:hypothetical protein
MSAARELHAALRDRRRLATSSRPRSRFTAPANVASESGLRAVRCLI